MTSPAQLKYLDAMGIPVWVSRELIVEDKLVVHDDKLENRNKNSAKDLIESLNAPQTFKQQSKPSQLKKTKKNQPSVHVVNTAKEPREPASNQIGKTALHELYGCGSLSADWLVMGQSPDNNESKLNQPYPYESGELLINMLRAVGVKQPRQDAYLINILESSNKAEEADIISAEDDLNKQLMALIQKIQPKILLIVGQLAAQNILSSKEPLARLRAKQYKQSVLISELELAVVVTYYPVYLLNKPQDKAKVWDDLKLAMKCLPLDES